MKSGTLLCFLLSAFLAVGPVSAVMGHDRGGPGRSGYLPGPGAAFQPRSTRRGGTDPIPLEELLKLEVPDSIRKKSDSVILLDDVSMELKGKRVYISRRTVKKILRAERHSSVDFSFFENGYNRIKSIEARAIHPDGSEEKLKKKYIIELPLFGEYEFYSDQKTKSFSFSDVKPGTVIEVVVKKEVRNLLFIEDVRFCEFVPVLVKRFSFVQPAGSRVEFYAVNMSNKPDTILYLGGDKKMLCWERRNIPPLKLEEMMPPVDEYVPTLSPVVKTELRYGKALRLDTWGDIASWYSELSGKALEITPEIMAVVEEVCMEGSSDLAKAEVLYNWVRKNVRYLSINLGLHGYMPHSAAVCLEKRYGDCKDQANLLVAMLKAAGVNSCPVIVRTSGCGKLDDPVLMPGYFNHVIAAALIEGDTIFMDPTCSTCPFGVLPEGDQGAHALMVMDGADNLITIPAGKPEENRNEITVEKEIKPSGSVSISCRLSYGGFFRSRIAQIFKSRSGHTMKDIAYILYIDESFGLDLGDVKLEPPQMGWDEAREIKLEYEVPSMIDTSRQVVFVNAMDFPLGLSVPEPRGRVYPVYLGLQRSYIYRASIDIPPGWRVIELPASKEIRNGCMTYVLKIEEKEGRLELYRCLKIRDVEIPVSDLVDVRKDILNIHRFERLKIPLGKTGS